MVLRIQCAQVNSSGDLLREKSMKRGARVQFVNDGLSDITHTQLNKKITQIDLSTLVMHFCHDSERVEAPLEKLLR